MRAAKVADLRRALDKRRPDQAASIREIKFKDLPGFADATLRPEAGFLSICGGTGLGKTALLELFRLSLEPRIAGQTGPVRKRLHNATVEIEVRHPDGSYARTSIAGLPAPADDEGYPKGVQFVGLAQRTSDLQMYFDDADIDVLKEGIDPINLADAELASISAVCRKSYGAAKIYEIDYEGDLVIPYVEVQEGGDTYDTRSMATGELSAFYLAWALRRGDPYSIILIEEPEAYLPPLSHAAVFAMICEHTLSRRLCAVITTHSAFIASEIPDRYLMPVRRQSGKSVLPVSAESKARVLSRLGLGPQRSAILFVEDELAASILRELMALSELELVSNLEVVVPGGGFGGVKRALEGLPSDLAGVRFVGVLDGDMKGQVDDWPSLGSVCFLPFARSMEVELLEAIARTPMKFASRVNRPAARIDDVLEGTKGQDHHDRWVSVAAGLALSPDVLVPNALERWMKSPGKKTLAQAFMRDLASKLRVSLP